MPRSVSDFTPEPLVTWPRMLCNWFWNASRVALPFSGPAVLVDGSNPVNVCMLLSTPFNAVTNLSIEAWAEEVSGLIVSVVGVFAADACCRLSVTPVIALLTTLLALVAAKPLIEKLASCAACVCVNASDDRPPSPPDGVTVMALAAPVAVPASTRRDPVVEVMMLAVTPGLLDAELIAAAMPASELLVESMVIAVDAPPTAMVRVPVPTAAALPANTGFEVKVAEVARLFTCSEYWPATASEVVVAVAMLLSATVAANPANWLASSSGGSASFRVSSAEAKVP